VTDRDMTRIQDGIVRQLQQALATQDDPRNSNDAMCPGVDEYGHGHGLTARQVHWGCCPTWDQYPGGEVR